MAQKLPLREQRSPRTSNSEPDMPDHPGLPPHPDAPAAVLPPSLQAEFYEDFALLRLSRPEKRNALNDATVLGIEAFFADLPHEVKAVVLDAEGDNFSAGLDLSELSERSTVEGVAHSMMWHRAFERIEFGRVPVISVLKGAVVGGGLELACATHIRVAERNAYYALPEGQRGIFVGGGASVRVPRLIGAARMADMMLTGRVHNAETGYALGLSQYLVSDGEGLATALDLARKIAGNAPITNFAVIHALPRIAEANPREGFMMEALVAAIAQGSEEAKERLRAFLEKRARKVTEFR
jgi:(methylthio)acryloyl-CoA hydratase